MATKSKEQYRADAKAKADEERRMDNVVSTHGALCQCVYHRSMRATAAAPKVSK
jgi:hypothetical protein